MVDAQPNKDSPTSKELPPTEDIKDDIPIIVTSSENARPVGNEPRRPVNSHVFENSKEAPRSKAFKPIAICGMACRLPGGIYSPQDLWKFLADGKDARSRVPETRWSASTYYSAVKKKGTARTEHGYYLNESVDLATFDTSAFPMSRTELERLDPQQRLLLEVATECLDDCGEMRREGSNIGVYVGCFGQDWYDVQNRETLKYSSYQVMGSHDFMMSERISHMLDLHGPCLTIRTACSSSMIALNEACMAISKGDCEGAIIGGTSIFLSPATVNSLSEQGVSSPEGSSKTFSSNADGYARGEGIVALYVKDMGAAIRDGNSIRAVVSGVATNFDGKTATLGRPSARGQEAAIRRAYEVAGIADPSQTGLFECHGTGTAAGDPIETEAIAAVFGEHGIHISSLKPNLGHAEGAAGVSAIMKAVLELERSTILPSIKAWPLSSKIPFERAKLTVASECTPWPAGRQKRVSINSFGIAGANAHAIIDSAESYGLRPRAIETGEAALDAPYLFVFSAHSARSLDQMGSNIEKLLETTPHAFPDVAYTLACRRRHLSQRSFFVSAKDKPVNSPPSIKQEASTPHAVVMIFTGQGAQWPQMGRDLLRGNRVFHDTISMIDSELQSIGAKWTIVEELTKNSRLTRVHQAEFAQPLCTSIQIALIEVLASYGIRPAAVAGHSSGEIAAAYAAGALSMAEAVAVAYHRGKITTLQTKPGAMAAISMSWAQTETYLLPGTVLACDNAHTNVTISGDADAITGVVANIKRERPGVLTTMLKVERAYHSHHMLEIGESYHQAMVDAGVKGSQPQVPFFSSVLGKLLSNEADAVKLDAKYWQTNLESPVLFKSAVVQILEQSDLLTPVFLEVGPHAALEGPIRQIVSRESRSSPHIATLTRRRGGLESLLTTIGMLWTLHVDVDLAALMIHGNTLSDLPSYPWDHQKGYWYEPRVSREWRLGGHPYHDLLGRRLPESTDIEPMWRNLLHLENVPWIYDHRIDSDIIFPFSAFVAMAAEAVQQIGPAQETVTLRNVEVSTALPVNEETPTELVTTLRRLRLTDSLESEFWEFTISSHNGHLWTRHCTGQIRLGSDCEVTPISPSISEALPRQVDSQAWYESVHRRRLSYGPQFTSMQRISASATSPNAALAALRNNWHGDEANYLLHPVIIDAFYQLMSLAAYNGLAHSYRRLVAAGVEKLVISSCRSEDLHLYTTGKRTADGGMAGEGHLTNGSKVVSQFSGLRLTLFEGVDSLEKDYFPLTSRAEWVSHPAVMDADSLFDGPGIEPSIKQKFDDLTRMAIQYCQRSCHGSNPQSNHLRKYQAWLQDANVPKFDDLSDAQLLASVTLMAQDLKSSPVHHRAEAIANLCPVLDSVLNGERNAYDVLVSSGVLENLVDPLSECDGSSFFRTLGRFKPNLRVLELSAGPSTVTSHILQSLRHEKGQDLFARYVVAKPSTGVLDAAKGQLQDHTNLEFICLNIEKNLSDQDFDNEEFDLIIASGTLHATSSIAESLSNIRKLLSKEGRVLLQDPVPGLLWLQFILGTLRSWWSAENDERSDGPYLSRERWAAAIQAAKLGNPQFVTPQNIGTPQWSTTIVIQQPYQLSFAKKVTLICGQSTLETRCVQQELRARQFDISQCGIEDQLPPGQDVVVLLDLEKPFFWDLTVSGLASFQKLFSSLDRSGVLWVTRQSQSGVEDPRYAPIIGLSRTLRSELSVELATCEVNDLTTPSQASALVDVFCNFQQRRYDGIVGPDYEYAISDSSTLVTRFFPFELERELKDAAQLTEMALAISKAGQLGTLHWSAQPSIVPIGDEIEIEIHVAGLNFRDVLVATGLLKLPETQFGYEAAGLVKKLGPDARKFRLGDRVLLVGKKTFASTVVQTEMLCEKIPDSMTILEAATIPLVFTTAIYGLLDIGHLEHGQSVLIHSGAGGVGLAAIQIARMVGATIFTTVSSHEKRQFLIDVIGIPDENILDSRSPSFVPLITSLTGGRGVDVALNSLSGELLHRTWACIAKWGTMVEIGKRDMLGSAKLDMRPFSDNRNYCCIDLDQMASERPALMNKLLRRMVELFTAQRLKPIRSAEVVRASAVADAFRIMQQSKHIGKIVVQLRNDKGDLLMNDVQTPRMGPVVLDSSAAYLLVGGLGGLGRSFARHMIQQGARNLVFMSRTAADSHHYPFIREIESMGCTVQCIKGTVVQQADIDRAIDEALAPVKGIINMTMSLADEAFYRMDIQTWNLSVEPKTKGTWNIFEVSKRRKLNLDFLVLISSLSAAVGQTGQANYTSANAFLDAFSQYASRQGVPCTTVAFGVLGDVGALSTNVELLRKLQGAGWRVNSESEFITTVDTAIQLLPSAGQVDDKPASSYVEAVDKSRFVFGLSPSFPLDHPNSSAKLRADARMAVYHNSKRQNTDSVEKENVLRTLLTSAKREPAILESDDNVNILAIEIGKKLSSLLLLPTDNLTAAMKTGEMGLDSMVAVEMVSWWKVTFGLELSTLEIVSLGTLHALGQRAATDLQCHYA